MNHPELVSNSLLVVSGSVDSVCNSASVIEEIMAAFGRWHHRPVKLGACVTRSGNLCVSDDLDRIHEILLAMTLDFVSMRPKW